MRWNRKRRRVLLMSRPIGDIDYRAEGIENTASVCPVCGSPVVMWEGRGMVWVGSADLGWAAKYGIVKVGGPYVTLCIEAECPSDPDHYREPVLLA